MPYKGRTCFCQKEKKFFSNLNFTLQSKICYCVFFWEGRGQHLGAIKSPENPLTLRPPFCNLIVEQEAKIGAQTVFFLLFQAFPTSLGCEMAKEGGVEEAEKDPEV